ncbi:MFS transporter [Fodinicurvata sediminis]|uniref:MFS transporter n=1 Tax=Fodinicurvata sediminis TaxID=1121832 RepID=UPI0003B669BE|nr:MFS transporter [Fodinicurvata sediminis]
MTTDSLSLGRQRTARRRFIAALGVGQIISWGTLYYSFPLIAEAMAPDLAADKPSIYGAATLGLAASSLAAYPIGTAIDRGHGRSIMAGGFLLGGLLLLAWSQVTAIWQLYPIFLGIGLTIAATLYDPAFAVVARRFGREARQGITALTLWGGFASTVFIPLIQFLLDRTDWRETLIVLGLVNLVVGVGLHLRTIDPRQDMTPGEDETEPQADQSPKQVDQPPKIEGNTALRWASRRPVFWALLIAFTLYFGSFSALTFHLYPLLLERGFDATTVVSAIAIIGPAQVAGRVVIWTLARHSPIRQVGLVATLGFPLALALLILLPDHFAFLALFALIYGAANGIMTIVRGLAIPEMLSRQAYGAINGAISVPSNAAKALAPVGAALLWSASGSYDSLLLAAIATALVVVASFATAAWYSARNTPAQQP